MARLNIRQALRAGANWLMPYTCIVCAGSGQHRDLCDNCARALPWNCSCCQRCAVPLPVPTEICGACATRPPPWSRACATFVYEFPVDSLLKKLKFSRALPNGRVLGELTADWIAATPMTRPDILIPVPLHWRRRMRRHFNQAEEIARPLAKRLLLPVETNLCRRKIHTPEQSGLDASRRRMNLRDAFAVTGDVSSLHVALIDDVMTTGSTLAALSKKLLAAGAAKVDVWTVARVAGSADQQPPPGREGVARIS